MKLKNIICGITFILFGVLAVIICYDDKTNSYDITASIFFWIIGISVIFADRQKAVKQSKAKSKNNYSNAKNFRKGA